jgi:hypothetical protein
MINFLTTKQIAELDNSELRYKVDELQSEVKRLNRMLIAFDIANQNHMDFLVENGHDMAFFKWVQEQKKGGTK